MYRIIVVSLFVIVCCIWGDLKRWKEFYPTFLFYFVQNLSYNFLLYNYPLWEYRGLLNHTFSEYFVTLFMCSSTIVLLLSHIPKKIWTQIIYIIFWVAIFTIWEVIEWKLGYFAYFHGWNYIWSLGFNVIMFPTLILHYKKPGMAWIVSAATAFLIISLFKVPYESMK